MAADNCVPGDRVSGAGNVAAQRMSSAKQALLAKLLAGQGTGLGQPQGPVAGGSLPEQVPLTPAQERIWLADQLADRAPLFTLGFTGDTAWRADTGGAQLLMQGLVSRHAALRSRVVVVDGHPVIRFRPVTDFHVEHIPLGEWSAAQTRLRLADLEREWLRHRFDLSGEPLIRMGLATFPDATARILVIAHHLIVDGQSLQIIMQEARHGVPPRSGLDYPDLAVWEASEPLVARRREQVDETVAALAGAADPVALPPELAAPAQPSFAAGILDLDVPTTLADQIRDTARRLGLTDTMVLLAVWALLVAHWSGRRDLVIGMPVSGRETAGDAGIVGPLVNTLVVPLTVAPDEPLTTLFEQTRARVGAALRRQDAPFNEVMARVYGRAGRIGVVFNKYAVDPAFFASGVSLPRTAAENGVALEIVDDGRAIRPRLIYQSELYTGDGMAVLGRRYVEALGDACADPGRTVASLLGTRAAVADRAGVDPDVETEAAHGEGDPAGTVRDILARATHRSPGRIAVRTESGDVTYRELNARVAVLRDQLLDAGVRPCETVAVTTTRSVHAVTALLAVLDAAAVYVPLPVDMPAGRRAEILASARPGTLVDEVPGRPGEPTRLRVSRPAGPTGDPRPPVPTAELCAAAAGYCLYTSGSAGRPAGVLVRLAALLAHARSAAAAYGITAEDRYLQFSGHGFDVWIEQAVTALTAGATLVLRGDAIWDLSDFAAEVAARGVTVANLPTPYWHELCARGPAALDALCGGPLREMLVGGDALDRGAVRTWFDRITGGPSLRNVSGGPSLRNVYGPTEAVITAVQGRLSAPDGDAASLPLGAAMSGRRAYVLDAAGRRVEPCAVGELYLGGRVAEGYLGDPRTTARRFLPDPFLGGGRRMYRTGDHVRLRQDGRLDFRGRRDSQVKISGIRIELGEVEAVLRGHPVVNEAVVLVGEHPQPHLTAWVRHNPGQPVPEAELRAYAAAYLPAAVVPQRIRVTDALPLTSGGKVDRAALRDRAAPTAGDHQEPARADTTGDPVAQEVAGIWASALGTTAIALGDDFFARGGTSLLATRVAGACSERFGVRVTLASVFSHPVMADLAEYIRQVLRDAVPGAAGHDHRPVPRSPVSQAAVALSATQQRFLFLSRYAADARTYSVPVALRIHGALDVDALARAVHDVLLAHESLRLSVPSEGDGFSAPRGEVVAVSFSQVRADLEPVEAGSWSRCRRRAAELAAVPVDLTRGPVRLALVRCPSAHLLVLCVHHIACDGESVETVVRQIADRYAAHTGDAAAMPEQVQYRDLALRLDAEQADALPELAARRAAALEGSRPIAALCPAGGDFDHRGAVVERTIDSDTLARVAARACVTPNAVLVALWELAIYRWTGQPDFVVGLPVSLRTEEWQHAVVGPLLNTVAVRAHFPAMGSLSDHLRLTQATLTLAYEDRALPFDRLVEAVAPDRDASATPLFQTLVAWEGRRGTLPVGSVEFRTEILDWNVSQLPLALEVSHEDDGVVTATIRYSPALVGADGARFLARTVDTALRVLDLDPDAPLHGTAAGGPVAAAAYPSPRIGDRFRSLPELVAGLPGDRPAVADARRDLTHAALEREVADAATLLRAAGVGRGDRVCTLLPRSVETVVALLAIMRCGAAYVPIDRGTPGDRIRRIVAQAGARTVVVHAQDTAAAGELPDPVTVVRLSAPATDLPVGDRPATDLPAGDRPATDLPAGDRPATDLPAGDRPDTVRWPAAADAAYLIFTSGSTGVPKGVVVGHGELAAVRSAIAADWGPEETVVAVTTVGFDVSVLELLVALSLGGRVVIQDPTPPFDPERLAALISAVRATRLYSVPSLWEQLLATGADLSGLIGTSGGEPLPPALARQARQKGVRLHNCYGPTETTIVVTDHPVDEGEPPAPSGDPDGRLDRHRIPVGHAIPGAVLHLLDRWLRSVRDLAEGELYIAGDTVAQGYHDDPRSTALKFLPDPFGPAGARMYRSGDRMRRHPGGALVFLGRLDDQVKVRGFRVELGEIEAVLSSHIGVREAGVALHGTHLVACVVPDRPELAAEDIRRYAAQRLPGHMVPTIVVVGALPLTANGKLDRNALKGLAAAGPPRRAEPPRDCLERVLAEIWSGVLAVPEPGRVDNFFDSGGDSLSALRIVDRVRRVLRTDLSVTDVFRTQTLAEQAARIREINPAAAAVAEVAERLLVAAKAKGKVDD